MSGRTFYGSAGFDRGTLLRAQLQELTSSLEDQSYPMKRDELVDTYNNLEFDVGNGVPLQSMLEHDSYDSEDAVVNDIEQYLSQYEY